MTYDAVVAALTPGVALGGSRASFTSSTASAGRGQRRGGPQRPGGSRCSWVSASAPGGCASSRTWTRPVVLGRADELTQVLLNLALNALDALPNGGTPRISTALRDPAALAGTTGEGTKAEGGAGEQRGLPVPHAALSVADDGPGIDAALRGRLFAPFATT